MKALAIDTAVSKISVACKNDDLCVKAVYDIGMKQSETLLPAIQYVMEKANVSVEELDCISICKGPGSFTGLRLGFAAVKAIEMVTSKPLFAFSTLDVYANDYLNLPFITISAIDAHKDKFYAKFFEDGKEIISEGDYEVSQIIEFINNLKSDKEILICGPDSDSLKELVKSTGRKIYAMNFSSNPCDALFELSLDSITNNKTGLEDYDGPVYLRASEAEENLKK